MVEQILPNNNEKCYNNFSSNFSQLNTAKVILVQGRDASTSQFDLMD
jgi:hypothetical protein